MSITIDDPLVMDANYDFTRPDRRKIDDQIIRLQNELAAVAVAAGAIAGGPTASRPVSPFTGEMYFDTDINSPIWWDTSEWSANVAVPSLAIPLLDINWNKSGVFTKTLANAANTITFSNTRDGMVIIVILTGSGSSSVTWPAGIKWPGGTVPTQTVGGEDIYTFVKAGSVIRGAVAQAMA